MKKTFLALFLLPILIIGNFNLVKAQTADYDYEIVGKSDDAQIYQGSRIILWVKIKNTGNKTWYNNDVSSVGNGGWINLICKPTATSTPGDCPFYTANNWIKPGTLRRMDEAKVLPGQVGSFGFYATPGDNLAAGDYKLNVVPTIEVKNNDDSYSSPDLSDKGISWNIKVLPKVATTEIYAAEVTGPKEIILGIKNLDQLCAVQKNQQATTLLTLGENQNINVDCAKYLQTREVQVKFDVKNIGNVTWQKSGNTPIHIATFIPKDRYSGIYDNSWLSFNRPAAIDGDNVGTGSSTSIIYKVKVPTTLSFSQNELIESFWLVAENKQWFTNTGLMDVRIVPQTGVVTPTEVLGCTDNKAENYNAKATKDDGGCKYKPVDNGQNIDLNQDNGENIDLNQDNGENIDLNQDNGETINLGTQPAENVNLN